jgi:hypothetical protein
MTRERYSAQRDLTATLNYAVPTGPHLILYLCGTSDKPHKGLRLGGEWAGKLPLRCPMCVHGRKGGK